MKLIPGRQIAHKILKSLQAISNKLPATLAVILVGNDPASHLYVSKKERISRQIGLRFQKYLLPANVKQAKVINLIKKLNQDKKITGMIVQLPLAKHLNTDKIISAIDPKKDADGLHPRHLKMLKQGQIPPVLPATTAAILEALKYTKTNFKNKSVAIIGKGKIAGLPTYYYLKNKVRQIAIYDSKTINLASKTRRADILIVAIGKAKFITQKYIKKDAIIIDVGINKIKHATVGDVDFAKIEHQAGYVTPVPGGIGPITVIMLLKNVITLYKNNPPSSSVLIMTFACGAFFH